ncbi:DUF1206 domain-containing protein [Muricoccus radiodurans]|uniref:DUF1206 domain-containing protein n=1 Tax=Muricoccus radiodurans TaxID=2231721 RepID=UPI003CFAF70A
MAGSPNHIELLARFGYAARGVVSLLVGILALLAAFGRGGAATGSRGALQSLLSQPWGAVLLALMAIGLFGFALWRILQALMDADQLGRSWRAMATRAGQLISAAIYVGLGVFAVSIILDSSPSGGEDQAARDWTRWLLRQPLGRWMVAAVGLAILGAAIGMAVNAWSASFKRHLACGPDTASWVIPLGRAGYAARALAFAMMGAFLLVAAYRFDPRQARGLGGALLALQEQPFGRSLFALVALGLAAFGIFQFVEARYRRIAAPTERQAVRAITS